MQEQIVALLLAIAGGAAMGVYPAFIKTPSVLAADVHPVVFQCYKSAMVFVTGWLFLIPRYASYRNDHDAGDLYVFSYWGVVSAAAWVPSGISTIFAVPRIGMGMTVAVTSATGSVLSFLVFWLVFSSKMKRYSCGEDCEYFRAPIYLASCVLGTFSSLPAWATSRQVVPWRTGKSSFSTTPKRLQSAAPNRRANERLPPSPSRSNHGPRRRLWSHNGY